jgi:hypothetical protein
MPAELHEYTGNTFIQQSNNVLFSNFFATTPQGSIVFDKNTIDGGKGVVLFSLPNMTDIKFTNNIHRNADGGSLSLTLNDNSTVSKVVCSNNTVTVRSGGADIFTFAGTTANSRLADYSDLKVQNNQLDGTLIGASSGYLIQLADAVFANTVIDGNTGKRAGTRGIQLKQINLTDGEVTKNFIIDSQIFIQGGSVASIYLRMGIEQNRAQLLNIAEGTSDIVFTDLIISRNKLNNPSTSRALVYIPRAGTTAPAAGNVVRVSNNNFTNLSGVACVSIGANAAGHKFLFDGNSLSSPIEDLAAVYFGTGKNHVGSAVQTYAAQATISAAVTLTGAAKSIAIPVNTTSAAFSITLPATPAAGDTYIFTDANGTWGTNNLTIVTGTLHTTVANLVLSVSNVPATLQYINATVGWIRTS